MTPPIKSAKTAKEMLEAVCEDLEKRADVLDAQDVTDPETGMHFNEACACDYRVKASKYRAILKEME